MKATGHTEQSKEARLTRIVKLPRLADGKPAGAQNEYLVGQLANLGLGHLGDGPEEQWVNEINACWSSG